MPKTVYLTIDDAPSSDCINKLNYLDQRGIRAVWFAEGRRLAEYPDAAADIIRRGHILANHSMTHPFFSQISLEDAYDEIRNTHAMLNRIYAEAGITDWPRYFRFPYGDKGDGRNGDVDIERSVEGSERHAIIQRYLRDMGYTQPPFEDVTYRFYREMGFLDDVDWYWTYDSHDWCAYSDHPAHGIDSVEKVLARMDEDLPEGWRGLNNADSADIVLVHDHVTPDDLFMQFMDKLIAKGVTFCLP